MKVSKVSRVQLKKDITGYLFISPALIFFSIFSLATVFLTIMWSFTNYDGIEVMEFVGLRNYRFAFNDPHFLETFVNIAKYVVLAVPLSILVPLGLAVLLYKISKKGNKATYAIRAVYYLPGLVSAVAAAAIFNTLLDPSFGAVNALLRNMGLIGDTPVRWLQDSRIAMFTIVILNMWMGSGGNMIIYFSALQGQPAEILEAAKIDGASGFQTFWRITFPLLRPTTFFIMTMSIIGSFQLYDQILMLTNGNHGTATPVFYIYRNAFGSDGFVGYASALAVILFAVIVVITLISQRLMKETY